MNEFGQLPESISHKQLNFLLASAKKETLKPVTDENTKKLEEFNELAKDWSTATQQLLQALGKKDNYFIQDKDPDALMALGALEVHLNMALQAYKASKHE